jgi:chitinase
MMSTYGFDGVDIDWEYPVDPDRGGKPADYKNFVTWMTNLKSALGKKGLSVTLPSSYWYLQNFDIKELEKSVDWFNMMLYDLHGTWDLTSKWTGPFVNAHTNLTEIQDALDLLWRNDIDPDKVVFGMGFYGRSFSLQNPSCSEPGCAYSSGGKAGICSNTVGVLLNSEIQDIVKTKHLTPKLYRTEAVKTITWDSTQWVSFDDEETFKIKGDLARSQCIKNVMVWAVSHDDINGTNAKALTTAIGREVMSAPNIVAQPVENPPKEIKACRWSNCGESCPSGFKNVPRNGTDQMMVDSTGCAHDGSVHSWCCPSDYTLPVCTWRGFRNSGACSPGCAEEETEVGTLSVGCSSKHQSACCEITAVTKPYSVCKWFGEAPRCSGAGGYKACEGDWPHRVVSASQGAGGEQVCDRGAKSYCCKEEIPAVFTDCAWHKKETSTVINTEWCETSCPAGQIRLSMQRGSDCQFGGLQAYCCKGPEPVKLTPRDPSWGNNQYKEYIGLIQAWAKNPSCPLETLDIDGNDYFYDIPSGLTRRAECKETDFIKLVNWIVTLLRYPTATPDALKYGWDNIIAQFDSSQDTLGYDNLQALIATNDDWDPRGLVSDVLLDPYMAQRNIWNYQDVQNDCSLGPTWSAILRREGDELEEMESGESLDDEVLINASDRHNSSDVLEERRIYVSQAGTGPGRNLVATTWRGQPDAGTILDGIERGDLILQYNRWQQDSRGIFLELAYQ